MLVSLNAVNSVPPGPLFLANLFIMCGWLVIFYEKDKIHSRDILRKCFSNTSIHKDTGDKRIYNIENTNEEISKYCQFANGKQIFMISCIEWKL